jgi:hypothetical protein
MRRHPHQRRRENARNVIAHWFDEPPPAERGRRRDLRFHLEPDVVTEHGEVTWQTDSEFIGANHAEHAIIGDYELLVFDLPVDRAGPAVIGWELFGPPRHQELIDHGDEQTFDDAKAAAERAFAKL